MRSLMEGLAGLVLIGTTHAQRVNSNGVSSVL
jgi:hypothetical protein